MLTTCASPALFPSFVTQCSVRFDQSAATAQQFPELALPPSMATAVTKRKNEFLAGRWCAQRALRCCAPELAGSAIEIGRHRQPLWPPGIVGSITHTRDFASVAVARTIHARGIGLDAEVIIGRDVALRIARDIAAEDELSTLTAAGDMRPELALTVVFSAKEALFKALYPQVGRYFDFNDVRFAGVDLDRRAFQLRLASDLTTEWKAGALFDGMYEVSGAARHGLVCTAIVVP